MDTDVPDESCRQVSFQLSFDGLFILRLDVCTYQDVGVRCYEYVLEDLFSGCGRFPSPESSEVSQYPVWIFMYRLLVSLRNVGVDVSVAFGAFEPVL